MSEAERGEHTPGNWTWWTSCSWRRLRSDLGHGKTADVLMPCVHSDGQADITVSEADMHLLAAAPDMLAALKQIERYCDTSTDPAIAATARAALSRATGQDAKDNERG